MVFELMEQSCYSSQTSDTTNFHHLDGSMKKNQMNPGFQKPARTLDMDTGYQLSYVSSVSASCPVYF